jgi:hypothetical protein
MAAVLAEGVHVRRAQHPARWGSWALPLRVTESILQGRNVFAILA